MSSSDAFFTTTPPGSPEIPVDPMDWGGDDLETTSQRPQAPAAPPSMKSSRPASPSAPTPDPKRWKGDKDGSDDADDENASQVSRDSTPMHTDDPVAFYGQSGDGSPIGLTGGDGDINSDAKAVFDSLLSIKEWLHYRERSTSPLTAQMCVALAHRITELFEGAADLGLINLLAKDAGNDPRTIETLCAVRDACILHVPYPGNPLPSPPFPAPSGGAGPSTSSAAKGKQREGAKPPATPNSKQTDAAPAATKPVLKRSYARPTPGGPPPPIPRHSRPLPGGTFAAAARRAPAKTPAPTTNTSVEGILALAKVFPELSASEISTLYQQNVKRSAGSPSSPPPSKRVKSTTRGPSRMQIIVYAEATFTSNLETVVTPLNNRLASNRRRLRVAQAFTGMGGIVLATQSTPTAEDLPVVIDAARSWFPANTKVTAEIPASRSYLKIVNIPFFQKVGGAPITQDLVESRICQDPVTKNFHLASKPRVSRNSPASDSCTVWFDIWDTQSGANLKQLVNKRLSFGGQICMIRPAEKRPGTPQCQRCWKWGHIDTRCSLNRNICAHCGGPHGLQYHRVLGSCCKAKPKENPPVEATHPDEDCPHPPKCVNCGGEHLANAKTCPYFRHRFEPEWIKGRYERDANVNRNYELVSNILEERKSSFDLLLIQEPPWNFIRRTVSATNPEGEAVVGPPIHPDWMVIFRRPKGEDDRPRVMTYVNKRLAAMRPAFRTDLADHRDILVLTLWGEDNTPLHYINVYSDQSSTAINWLCDNVERLPQLQCMAGDFNCHSSVWDSRHEGNNHVATSLIDAASDLGVEVSVQPVRTPTHFPHARGLVPSVIDLMFLPQDRLVGLTHEVRTDWIGPSDHAPLCVTLPIRATEVASERLAMPKGSEEESSFLQALLIYIKSMDISNIDTRDALEDLIAGLARACNDAWNSNAKTVKVNTRSKAWWNADCATAMRQYRQSRSPADYGALRRATKAAKRQFFDERIETIATKNKRPWDLMNWTKQRNLPTYEAIRYNEAPCNTMDDFWQALHATYNAASDRPVKVEVLEEVEQEPPREWVDFSTAELREELAKCSNTSAPGPDHLTWYQLKKLVIDNDVADKFTKIASACLRALVTKWSQRPGSTTTSRWPDSRLSNRAFGASILNIVKMESDEDDLSDPDANKEESSDLELLALQVKQFWDTTNVLSEHRRRRLEERADRLVLRSTGAQVVGEMVAQDYAGRYLEVLSVVFTEYRKKYPKGTSNSAVSSIAGTPVTKKAPLNKGKGHWDDLFTPQAVASGSNQPLDEAAMAVSALHQARQLGESDDDYRRWAAAAEHERMTHLPTERKDTIMQPAGNKSTPAIQVPMEAKDGRVPLAKDWNNRVAYQRLRNTDLSWSKFMNYDDQGVVFEGHMPVDEMARQWASQTQGSDGGLGTGAVGKHNTTATANGRQDMQESINCGRDTCCREQHKTKMHEWLHQLIHERLAVQLLLPDRMKSRRADSKSIGTYSGSATFSELEEWLLSLVVMLAVSQFGGAECDQERVLITSAFLNGEAWKWYNRHVIHVNREKQSWTFKDVILGLYDQFVLPSTMQDARNDFNAVTYSASKGIQGLYDDLVDHTMNMAARTDDWMFLEKFLKTLLPQKTADYFERNISAQQTQSTNEKSYTKPAVQEQPGRGDHKPHINKLVVRTGDHPHHDHTKNLDHHNHPPGEIARSPRNHERSIIRAAHTAAIDAASEADDKDTSPEDPDRRETGRHDTEADKEDEDDEFVDMEVYNNEYYARDDEAECMFATTEVMASEERKEKPPIRRVKVRMGRDKIGRPVLPLRDKECLVTY
ncbi:hypothetical protein D9615_007779 [Tricholomella constricta]|uniref:Endonuclease/exonuclease/phosphatase domain-containing protein n=1 Tax=Tricholomella constricta TaxID=117010 RepID=A0A8H5H3P3_9AGAR|nr:hypothetical protein D9615_007779 [Tricholomella constricta]